MNWDQPIRCGHLCEHDCPFFEILEGADADAVCTLLKEEIPYHDGHIAICPSIIGTDREEANNE